MIISFVPCCSFRVDQGSLGLFRVPWISYGSLGFSKIFGFLGFLRAPKGFLGFLRVTKVSLWCLGFLSVPYGSFGFLGVQRISQDALLFLRASWVL